MTPINERYLTQKPIVAPANLEMFRAVIEPQTFWRHRLITNRTEGEPRMITVAPEGRHLRGISQDVFSSFPPEDRDSFDIIHGAFGIDINKSDEPGKDTITISDIDTYDFKLLAKLAVTRADGLPEESDFYKLLPHMRQLITVAAVIPKADWSLIKWRGLALSISEPYFIDVIAFPGGSIWRQEDVLYPFDASVLSEELEQALEYAGGNFQPFYYLVDNG